MEAAREHVTLTAQAMERLEATCVEREGRIAPRVQLEVVASALGAIRAEPDGEWWSNWREAQILLLTRAEPNEQDLAAFTDALPHANVHRVPGAGHDVLTNPGFVIPHVTDFLTGV